MSTQSPWGSKSAFSPRAAWDGGAAAYLLKPFVNLTKRFLWRLISPANRNQFSAGPAPAWLMFDKLWSLG